MSSPGETMPRSDSAESQSQVIQEEPLPSTSNDEEDPLAGTFAYTFTICVVKKYLNNICTFSW